MAAGEWHCRKCCKQESLGAFILCQNCFHGILLWHGSKGTSSNFRAELNEASFDTAEIAPCGIIQPFKKAVAFWAVFKVCLSNGKTKVQKRSSWLHLPRRKRVHLELQTRKRAFSCPEGAVEHVVHFNQNGMNTKENLAWERMEYVKEEILGVEAWSNGYMCYWTKE